MASKKTGNGPDLTVKKRYLSDAQCKATAARISAEMREDREGREKWGDMWFVSHGNQYEDDQPVTFGKNPTFAPTCQFE